MITLIQASENKRQQNGMHRHFAVPWTLPRSCPRNAYLKITKKCSLYYHNLSGYIPVAIPNKIKEKFHNTILVVFLFLPKPSMGEVGEQKENCIDHNEQSSLIPAMLYTSIKWMAGHTLLNAECAVSIQGRSCTAFHLQAHSSGIRTLGAMPRKEAALPDLPELLLLPLYSQLKFTNSILWMLLLALSHIHLHWAIVLDK